MTETLSPALPTDLEGRVQAVLRLAARRGVRLVTAESCTGGLVASLLTDVDGFGKVFERGFVVYTDEAKHELLGVPHDLLARHGAVSAPVAVAMAEGALANSQGDLAIAVTGYAGPAGPDDPQGLVYFGLAKRGGGPGRCEQRRFGKVDRGEGRLACLRVALEMIADGLRR